MPSGYRRVCWNIICDILWCYQCQRFVRICYGDSAHALCSQCKLPLSAEEILYRNPELYRWYRQWGGVRLLPIGGVARGTSGIASPDSPPHSSHSNTAQPVLNQEVVDSAAGPSQPPPPPPPPPQERPSSSSTIPTTPRSLPVTPHELPPDHVDFCIDLFLRQTDFGEQAEPPLPASGAFATVTLTSELVKGRQGTLGCADICCPDLKFEVGEEVKELPCKHLLFHKDCFVPWLLSNNCCLDCGFDLPLCWEMLFDGSIQLLGGQRNDQEEDQGAGRQGGSGEAGGRQGGSDGEEQASS